MANEAAVKERVHHVRGMLKARRQAVVTENSSSLQHHTQRDVEGSEALRQLFQ